MHEPKLYDIRANSEMWLEPFLMDYEADNIYQALEATLKALKRDDSPTDNLYIKIERHL